MAQTEKTKTSNDLADGTEAGRQLTLGQLGMWVFISTEVMMFVAIMAVFLVNRLSSVGTGWPRPILMHSVMLAGVVNTLVLVLSGVTAWMMYRASQEDRPQTAKIWLIATLLLGCTFCGIKSWEYLTKYQYGLLPVNNQQQIYDEASIDYLANVNQRVKDQIAHLESEKDSNPEAESRLELLYGLKQNMFDFTTTFVGQSDNSYFNELAIKLMAYQIFPHEGNGRNVEAVLEPEQQALWSRRDRIELRTKLIDERQAFLKQQIATQEEKLKQFQLLNSTDGGISIVDEKRWLEVKKKQAQDLVVERLRLETMLKPVAGRIENIESTIGTDEEKEGPFVGLNKRHNLQLPVVITNGQRWINMYLLLTGMHALHLLVGLLILFCWLPFTLNSTRAPTLYICCMYWQFVDIVWLAIFWFLYF